MIRRLLTLVLALALLPIAVPRGAPGSLVGRRHRTTADRFTAHCPIAMLAESLLSRSVGARSARRYRMALPIVAGSRVMRFGEQAPHRQSNTATALPQGAVLVPLRI